MAFAAAVSLRFATLTSILTRMVEGDRTQGVRPDAGSSGASPAAPHSQDATFEMFVLDVAFTPYGPEVQQFWIPATVALSTDSGIKKGDLL